LLQTLWVIWV